MSYLNVLILDDEEIFRSEVSEFLRKKKYKVFESETPTEAFEILNKTEIDIVILDINLPEKNGLEVLKEIKSDFPDIEVIMITGAGSMRIVIDAFRLGAFDFFPKPFKLINIQASIERTKRFLEIKSKLSSTQEKYSFVTNELRKKIGTEIIGESEVIKSIILLMTKIANAENTNVLITGESGTGKELIAQGIHNLSSRKDKMFFDVNCSAVPESLFESEFFGHQKGAFTGALENKTGWFQLADKGTLFLDEIGDLQANLQTKFLRVLEQSKIRKVGSSRDISIDVRIIAATNKNLEEMIQNNEFRSDLFYRFSSFHIHIPPLRERKEDIPILVKHFVKNFAKKFKINEPMISDQALQKLLSYDFPGNIRELKNMIERALIIANDNLLLPEHFSIFNQSTESISSIEILRESFDLNQLVEDLERKTILSALSKENYNKAKTIGILNITRQSFLRRIKKYKINIEK